MKSDVIRVRLIKLLFQYFNEVKMKTIIALQLALALAFSSGWCMSLYKLTKCDFEPSYKAEIIYGVGLVTPISIVTGWMDFGK